MPFVVHTGEVVPDEQQNNANSTGFFQKDKNGYKLNTPEEVQSNTGSSDWWKLPAAVTGAGVGGALIYHYLKNSDKTTPANSQEKIDPSLDSSAPPKNYLQDLQVNPPAIPDQAAPSTSVEQAQQRSKAISDTTGITPKGAVNPVTYESVPDMSGNTPKGNFDYTGVNAAVPPIPLDQASKTGLPATPDVVQASATETPITIEKPVEQTTATPKTLRSSKQPPFVGPAPELIGPPVAPPGMRVIPPLAANNKAKGDVFGVGAYTHTYNTYGDRVNDLWKDAIGTKNTDYKTAVDRLQNMNNGLMTGGEPGRLVETPIEPGPFGRPRFGPDFIQGKASIPMLAGTAALATLPSLASAGYQAYQGNKDAINSNLKDAWESLKSVATMPYDVAKAAKNGDFGPFKDLLMSANPALLLMNETGKVDDAKIQQMIAREKQAKKVGVGRGTQSVPPPL